MHTYFKKLAQESSLPSSSKSEISINEYCRVLYHVLLFSDTPPKFFWASPLAERHPYSEPGREGSHKRHNMSSEN